MQAKKEIRTAVSELYLKNGISRVDSILKLEIFLLQNTNSSQPQSHVLILSILSNLKICIKPLAFECRRILRVSVSLQFTNAHFLRFETCLRV